MQPIVEQDPRPHGLEDKAPSPSADWGFRPSIAMAGAVALVLVTWAVVGARLIPGVELDRGIFVSVAERIAAGDRLYIDVWDNKDPLFYLLGSLGRLVSPYADIGIEVAWVLAACLAVTSIAKSAGLQAPRGIVVGFAATPLVLTGPLYWAGYTELPGIALALATFAAALDRRYFVAGSLVAILAFFKLVIVPMGLLLLVVTLVSRRDRRSALRAAGGLLAVAAAALALLGLRGELKPYFGALSLNREYAQRALGESAMWAPFEHLSRVFSDLSPVALVCPLALTMVLLWAFLEAPPRDSRLLCDTPKRILLVSSVASALLAMITLAVTGLWPHHAQILYIPALIGLVVLVASARVFTHKSGVLPIALIVVVAVMLGGALDPRLYWRSILHAEGTVRSLSAVPVEAAAILSMGEPGTYARIGQNDDQGHALGLREWTLACPRFHQYFTDSRDTLVELVNCLDGVDVILKSPTGREFPLVGSPQYNEFIAAVDSLLTRDYTCAASPTVYELFVCRRNAG